MNTMPKSVGSHGWMAARPGTPIYQMRKSTSAMHTLVRESIPMKSRFFGRPAMTSLTTAAFVLASFLCFDFFASIGITPS